MPDSFGRYKVVRLLGRGGMGSVYLAHVGQLDRQVALKVPHIVAFADRPDVRERFFREAQAAARFHHPNFCPIYDIGEVAGVPYLTMAFVEGKTLAASIDHSQGWPPRRAAEVTRELALALAEAHRGGVIHRDLKPANIMVDARGRMVLMDFGLARWFDDIDSRLTAVGEPLGTPAYMPPEQAAGNLKAIGPRSDLYSLGVILYELLTGRRPFEGALMQVLGMIAFVDPTPPSTLRPGLDPRLEAICLKAMAKQPDDRYASMDEFAGALQAWLDEDQASPPLESGSKLPHSKEAGDGRYPIRTWIAAAAAFAAVLFGIIYVATDKGRIKIEVNDPSAVVHVDGQQVRIEGLGDPITLRAGEHELSVKRGDVEVDTRKFVVRRGDNPALSVVLEPIPPKGDGTLITNTLGMTLKLIPAGEFQMGSDASDPDAGDDEKVNGKKHPVRITRPFYLGTTEVTVGQFRQFVEKSSYKTEAERDGKGGYGWNEAKGTFEQDPKYTWRSPGFPQTDDHPVVNVSWNDAVVVCEWLSKKEGQTYRLPTEAEWECSCRAGQATRYSSGDGQELLAAVGNVADGTAKENYPDWAFAIKAKDGYVFTAPVGRFRPNAFGLFDMHGNVWEWCADGYESDYYAKSPLADPLNSSQAALRVMRGGCWRYFPRNCRSAYRVRHAPDFRYDSLGFRVALVRSGL